MEYLEDIQRLQETLLRKGNGQVHVTLTAWEGNLAKVETESSTVVKISDIDDLLTIMARLLNEAQRIEYDGTMNLAINFKRGKLKELSQTNKERKIYGE